MQTFAKMPLEVPEDIFTVLIFCDKTLYSAVPTGLLQILAGLIFAVVGSSAKTAKVCIVQKFPAIQYLGNISFEGESTSRSIQKREKLDVFLQPMI